MDDTDPDACLPSVDFLGLRLTAVDTAEAARLVAARPSEAPFAYVVTPNAQHMVALAAGHRPFRAAYAGAWLVLSDGHVVQPLARSFLGLRLPQASGSDLTTALLRDHIRPDDAITVIGGGERLDRALRQCFGLRNLAIHDPPYGFIDDPAAVEACQAFLAAHPARYVFLAVGSPQSEILAARAAALGLLTGTCLCIGGSLLYATGLVKRAPTWVQRAGLEGVYRLLQNPRGHFHRVFVQSLPIVWIMLRARFGGAGILPAAAEAAEETPR